MMSVRKLRYYRTTISYLSMMQTQLNARMGFHYGDNNTYQGDTGKKEGRAKVRDTARYRLIHETAKTTNENQCYNESRETRILIWSR